MVSWDAAQVELGPALKIENLTCAGPSKKKDEKKEEKEERRKKHHMSEVVSWK